MTRIYRINEFESRSNIKLGYTDFFGKEISHEEALLKMVTDFLVYIYMDEFSISEKSFGEIDRIVSNIKSLINGNQDILKRFEYMLSIGKRKQYAAEILWDELKDNFYEKNKTF